MASNIVRSNRRQIASQDKIYMQVRRIHHIMPYPKPQSASTITDKSSFSDFLPVSNTQM